MPVNPFSPDDLVQHAAAMRSLARDLLGDDALADDALQQARLAALRRPPAQPVAIGAWLRAVVRRCAVDVWRSERRRSVRERAAARPEAFEPPDTAELLEVQEDVVAAVRALDEPYRTAVWLRYYEDLPPAAIAERTGDPVKTIKTRLWRALQLLRARLDARHGERSLARADEGAAGRGGAAAGEGIGARGGDAASDGGGERGAARPVARGRERADRRAGWALALLPLARDPALVAKAVTRTAAKTSTTTAALAAGITWMSAKTIVGSFALVALGAGAWWLAGATDAPPGPEQAATTTLAAASAAADAANALAATSPAAAERTPAPDPLPAADASPYGALRVRVTWHDGTRAADVAIDANVRGEPQVDRNELRFVSDADGVAIAPRVHAGRVTLTSDRGGEARAEIRGGATAEVEFRLPRGIDVTGIVVDEQRRPVAGAEVVVVSPRSGWRGGRTLARSGANGAFALRSIDPRWSIGARGAGFAPSELVDLEYLAPPAAAAGPEAGPDDNDDAGAAAATSPPGAGAGGASAPSRSDATRPGVVATLVLSRPGATVTGTVVDDAGAPIAGALVVLGRGGGGHHESQRTRETWSPHVVAAAADGSFRCDGVAPGDQPIVARADDCSRATADVPCVAGETANVRLVLSRGFVVRGVARDDTGAPAAGAIVTTIDPVDLDDDLHGLTRERTELKRPRVVADAAGAFELRAVAPGATHLLAAVQDPAERFRAFAQTTVTGGVGDALTWDPVLTAGKTLRVRVVDETGAPVRLGAYLYATAERPAGPATRLNAPPEHARPGVFEFVGCADVPYTVSAIFDDEATGVRSWPYVTGAVPGGPEAVLRLPKRATLAPGAVSCRVVDGSGRTRRQPLDVRLDSGLASRHSRRDGDRHVIDDVAPGRHRLWVRAGGVPLLVGERFEVGAGQQVDLGDVVIAPRAAVRVALRAADGASIAKPAADLGENYHRVPLTWDGTHLVTDDAPAGRQHVRVRTGDWFAPPRAVELRAGEETLVEIDVVPACMRRFRVVVPLPDRWQSCTLAVRDAAGTELATSTFRPDSYGPNPLAWHVVLPLQSLALEATLDGVRHSWPIDCRDASTTMVQFRFSLR